MKARIKDQAAAGVWLYLPQADTAVTEVVQTAAARCDAVFGSIGPESAGMRVADILSGNAQSVETDGFIPAKPVLLMNGFNRAGLDRFLAALREEFQTAGLPGIALKAIVTPTNRSWDFCRLAEELQREHDLMQRGR